MKTKLLFALVCVTFVVLASVVYTALILWQGNVTVNVTSLDVGVYWDESCTNPVSTIDFGSLLQGATFSKTLYIKNKGTTTVTILYTSTLSSVSSGKITDTWTCSGGSVNGVSLSAGQVILTTYAIEISATCPAQTFNWVINLGV